MHGSVASVVAAIREEGVAEVERVERNAQMEIESLRVPAEVTLPDREQRLAAARRDNAEKLAQQEWESRRAAIEQREEWMRRVVARGRELLASRDDDSEALIREAGAHLPAGEHEVTRAPGGGVIVTCRELTFDNSYDARARRLEPEWRKTLSEVYR